MIENERKNLTEEELEKAAGGWSENRYDPKVCPVLKRVRYECHGMGCWCDHYRQTLKEERKPWNLYTHECVMGCFNYEGDMDGK
jgi:hypothetical protein